MRRIVLLILGLWGAMAVPTAVAGERQVPAVLAFQSALFDDGGNPIPDGDARVAFRVVDASGAVLYEEHQVVGVLRGEVSALVGNGLAADGTPTGGLSPAVLLPEGPRFLVVEVEGMPPMVPMEVASAPYAVYAGEALGVADGSLAFEDLSDDLIARLATAISDPSGRAGGALVRGVLQAMSADAATAASIGVRPAFAYSAARDVQGALEDFDRALRRREERIDREAGALAEEAQARSSADSVEAQARGGADAAEVSARLSGDTAEVQARSEAIAEEAGVRVQRDEELAGQLGGEIQERTGGDAALSQRVDGLDAQVAALSQMRIRAWGSVVVGGAVQMTAGGNARAEGINSTMCWIAFDQPLADAAYAVVTTPAMAVSDKASDRFKAACPTPQGCTFDFIVVAR